MKLFVRLIVFVLMIFAPGILVLLGATATASQGMPIPTAFFFCVGGFAGYWFSGKAMDSVAGKLPPDEQP